MNETSDVAWSLLRSAIACGDRRLAHVVLDARRRRVCVGNHELSVNYTTDRWGRTGFYVVLMHHDDIRRYMFKYIDDVAALIQDIA